MSEGFSARTRNVINSRAEWRGVPTCEIQVACTGSPSSQIHHRRPRGMGGSKRISTNQPSNGLSTCPQCHHWVESHREEAISNGWIVRQHQQPIYVGVSIRGQYVYLDDDGQKLGNTSDPIQPLVPGVTNA